MQNASHQIQEDEDDLILRAISNTGRAVLVRLSGGCLCVLSLWDGEHDEDVSVRHGAVILARGTMGAMRDEMTRVEVVSDVMES